MQTLQVFARLDKSRDRVLCGADSCGCPLALVLSTDAERVLFFGAFWARLSPGVWRMSQSGRQRIEAHRADQRADPYVAGFYVLDTDGYVGRRTDQLQSDLEAHLAFLAQMDKMPYRSKGRVPVLPALAKCPICGRTQVLDPGRLGVVSGEAAAPHHAWADHFPTEEEVSRYACLARTWINRLPQLKSPTHRAWYGLDKR